MENKDRPAFPITEEQTDRIEEGVDIYYGLTKREYFAAAALQGLLASETKGPMKRFAKESVELADELIKAL